MKLQQIIDHLAACVRDMNDNSVHDLAMMAQTAIVAVDALQSACAEDGYADDEQVGDWPITPPDAPGEPR